MVAAVVSEVDFMDETAILAATMAVLIGQAGEIIGFHQANGEEENSYQMGHLEGQEAGAAGKPGEGFYFRHMVEIAQRIRYTPEKFSV